MKTIIENYYFSLNTLNQSYQKDLLNITNGSFTREETETKILDLIDSSIKAIDSDWRLDDRDMLFWDGSLVVIYIKSDKLEETICVDEYGFGEMRGFYACDCFNGHKDLIHDIASVIMNYYKS